MQFHYLLKKTGLQNFNIQPGISPVSRRQESRTAGLDELNLIKNKKVKGQKITAKKHFKHIWPFMFFLIGMYFIAQIYSASSVLGNRVIYAMYIILIPVCIVSIYLHFEYFIVNRGVTLFHNKANGQLIYEKKGQKEIILPSIIERIEVHQSRFYKRKSGFLPTDKYRFYKLFLKGNGKIIVTSLLYPDFDTKLKEKQKLKNTWLLQFL